jgi:hypothetical protein
MRKIRSMWENLKESGCPELRDDVELEFRLALLDYYIRPCIEEFIVCGGTLEPSTIFHLRNCKRNLASLLKKSNGVILCYFEQLLMLSKKVDMSRSKGLALLAHTKQSVKWSDSFFRPSISSQ